MHLTFPCRMTEWKRWSGSLQRAVSVGRPCRRRRMCIQGENRLQSESGLRDVCLIPLCHQQPSCLRTLSCTLDKMPPTESITQLWSRACQTFSSLICCSSRLVVALRDWQPTDSGALRFCCHAQLKVHLLRRQHICCQPLSPLTASARLPRFNYRLYNPRQRQNPA